MRICLAVVVLAFAACGGAAKSETHDADIPEFPALDPGARPDFGDEVDPGRDLVIEDASEILDPGLVEPGPSDLGTWDPVAAELVPHDPAPLEVPEPEIPVDLPGDSNAEKDLADPGPQDTPTPDDTAIGAYPYVQCEDDKTCQQALGPSAVCNRAFPGGQCQNCSPGGLGDAKCGLLGKDGLTLTCKETIPPVCLFDCPCPPWLKCLQDVCALRTCATDADCVPFVCRPLSQGGNRYCLSQEEN